MEYVCKIEIVFNKFTCFCNSEGDSVVYSSSKWTVAVHGAGVNHMYTNR